MHFVRFHPEVASCLLFREGHVSYGEHQNSGRRYTFLSSFRYNLLPQGDFKSNRIKFGLILSLIILHVLSKYVLQIKMKICLISENH